MLTVRGNEDCLLHMPLCVLVLEKKRLEKNEILDTDFKICDKHEDQL